MAEFVGLASLDGRKALDPALRRPAALPIECAQAVRWPGGVVACTPALGPEDMHRANVCRAGDAVVCDKTFSGAPLAGEGAAASAEDVIRREGCYGTVLIDTAPGGAVTLISDRLGTVPIFLAEREGVLYFASRLSLLQKMPGLRMRLSVGAISRYLDHMGFWNGETPYEGVRHVLPGTYEEISASRRRAKRHWSPVFRPRRFTGTAEELVEECRQRLCAAVRGAIRPGRPVGVMLSGGLDSALLTVVAGEISREPVHTYSVVFASDNARWDERAYSRQIAEAVGTNHHELELTEEYFAAALERFLDALDLPATGGLVPFMAMEASGADGVSVHLNGEGADTAFGLNKLWLLVDLLESACPLPRVLGVRETWALAGRVNRLLYSAPMRPLVWRCRPLRWMRHYFRLRSGCGSWNGSRLSPSQTAGTFLPRWRGRLGPSAAEKTCQMFEQADTHLFSDMMGYLTLLTYIYGHDIRIWGLMAARYGQALFLPFMAPEVLTYATTLPIAYRRRTGWSKYVVRELCKRHLGEEYARRAKMAFVVPLRSWLTGRLKPLVDDALGEESVRARGLFDPQRLAEVRAMFQTGLAAWVDVWAYVVLELWLRKQEASLGYPLVAGE